MTDLRKVNHNGTRLLMVIIHLVKSNYYSVNVLTDRGEIAYYNYDEGCWVVEPLSAEIDPPVAWCEIPKYEGKK